jgi:hypothetical protein
MTNPSLALTKKTKNESSFACTAWMVQPDEYWTTSTFLKSSKRVVQPSLFSPSHDSTPTTPFRDDFCDLVRAHRPECVFGAAHC